MTQSLASQYGPLFKHTDWNTGQLVDLFSSTKHAENPYYKLTISPYIPNDQLALSNVEKNPLFSGDYSIVILNQLDVEDLANLSEVSKEFCLSLKSNSIWDIQFPKFFHKAKIVDQSFCSFSTEDQFKIAYKRFKAELKPFVAQYKRNNEILLRLRGPNGDDGELNQLEKEIDTAGGFEAINLLALEGVPNLAMLFGDHPGLQDALERAKKVPEKKRLYQEQMKLCEDLVGFTYDGTREKLAPLSHQRQILHKIEFTIPNLFKTRAFEKVILHSALQKNYMPENPIAKAWMEGIPLPLIDLGVLSMEDLEQKVNYPIYRLEIIGLSELSDFQTLGLLNEPFVKEIEMPRDAFSEDVSERNNQIYKRKESCSNLLNRLSEKIEKRIQENESYDMNFKNPFVEYKNRFEEVRRSILEKCESPTNLSKNYKQILKEINALIAEFNEQDRQYQIAKLHAYVHQEGLLPKWGNLNDHGIQTLTEYVALNPGVNLFKMGTEG